MNEIKEEITRLVNKYTQSNSDKKLFRTELEILVKLADLKGFKQAGEILLRE